MKGTKRKQRLLSILLCFMLIAGMMPAMSQKVYAETPTNVDLGTGISYTFDAESGVMTVSGTGDIKDFGSSPFGTNNTEVKTLIIEEGITGVGNRCFDYLKGLTEVQFPSTLTKIGFYSFGHCESLTELSLPDRVTTVDTAFPYCTSLKKITVGKGLRSIQGSSFCTQSMVEFDVDPENVYFSDIDGNLYNAAGTTLITYCAGKSAEEFTIPSDVSGIRAYAFSSCEKDVSALRKVVLPQNMKEIAGQAFRGASSLTEVILPVGLERINSSAFQYCSSLAAMIIPSTVKHIGQSAFEGTGITSVNLPASVITIQSSGLARMTELESITVASDNPSYKSIDGVLYTKDGKTLVQYPQKKEASSYAVPDGVNTIASEACSSTAFTSISFPSTLERIEAYAFQYSQLTDVVIPAGVSSIGDSAFYTLKSSLKTITVMNPYTEISNYSSLGTSTTALKSYNKCDGTASTTQTFAEKYSRSYEALGNAPHEYSAWESLYESTGEVKHSRKCANCDSTETEDCNIQDVEAKAATCTEAGYSAGKRCTECGYSSVGETIDPLDHDYKVETEILLESTCTATGLKKVTTTCSRCDYNVEKKVTIGMKSHKKVIVPGKDPTCTEYGLTEGAKCSECSMVITAQTRIVPLGHDWGDPVTTKATTSKDGSVVTKCSICGDVKSSKTIYYPKTIKLSTTSYTYSGGVKTPDVSVIDANGDMISSSNYSVSYASGCKSVGRYKVTVTFEGNKYSGSTYTYFNINPKGTSISKVTGAKKAFTVKWKKQSAKMATSTITGYQIRYSTSSKMTSAKTKTVKGYKYTSKKITKLSAKKKYYVQVRTYKTVSGKTYYSSWSGVKSVKTK